MNGVDDSIVVGQASGLRNLNDCGCCEGITGQTPVEITNRPGLTAIAYRVGTHARFRQSMLARLSAAEFPALKELRTREQDDFAIALLDSWATVADVLTFYQERIANESFLRTATERRSLLELARLVGYELGPGVAASTYLAFTLEEAPGAPEQAVKQTIIDIGTKVQSIPGPGEKPQTFETIEKIKARTEWNSLKPKTTELKIPNQMGVTEVYLKGIATNLKLGDALLFVGAEREANPVNNNWDFRRVKTIAIDEKANHTLVTLHSGLGSTSPSKLPAANPKIYALRLRAALFGHNAPDPKLLPSDARGLFVGSELDKSALKWVFSISDQTICLDTVYPGIVRESWLVLSKPTYQELYRVVKVAEVSPKKYTLTVKSTQIELDTSVNLGLFDGNDYSTTVVFAQSELLEIAENPLSEPLYGDKIALSQLAPDLKPGQVIAVSGKRARIMIADTAQGLQLTSAESSKSIALQPGDLLQLMSPPVLISGSQSEALTPEQLITALASPPSQTLRWHLMDKDGFTGFVTALSDKIALQAATKDDATVNEVAFIGNSAVAVSSDRERTTLTLREPLQNCYDRKTVTINANVARATHGETVREVLGHGDASQPYQRFPLRQPPLTYVSAPTPSGTQSTLEVRVNDILWKEAPTLFGRNPHDRVFTAHNDDEGKTTVQFGDGTTGARLPTGQNNVQAKYRKGIGLEGLVKAGQLTLLMTRPLGVRGVTNPLDATGAADPESRDEARQNAPLTVLTLDRIVSLRDYEDFTRAFAGIAKALATWTWEGQARNIFITVAGPNGAEVKTDSDPYKNLLSALGKRGNPYVRFRVKTYRKSLFRIVGKVKVDEPTFLREKVMADVEQALRAQFSFDARAFGQPVTFSEVIAVIQAVSGVVAVDVDKLYRFGEEEVLNHRLLAALPETGTDGEVAAAELLTLDTEALGLEVMS